MIPQRFTPLWSHMKKKPARSEAIALQSLCLDLGQAGRNPHKSGCICTHFTFRANVFMFVEERVENRIVKPIVFPTVGRRGLGGNLRNIRS